MPHDLRPELDALIAANRARQAEEDRALQSMAGALYEAARASSIITAIGQHLESLRQSVPIHSQPVPPPPPQSAISAQQQVDEEWQRHRQQAGHPATFANGHWPQE